MERVIIAGIDLKDFDAEFLPIRRVGPLGVACKKIIAYDETKTASLAALTGTELFTITPEVGYIARIISLNFSILAPTGATAGGGGHDVRLYLIDASNYLGEVSSVYNAALLLRGNDIATGTLVYPTSNEIFNRNLLNARFSSITPLILKYSNKTDAAQDNTRLMRVIVELEAVT